MALHDLGLLPFEEPFKRFRAHGLIIKDGAKMSKSRGNVVTPDTYLEQHGADVFRIYMMFLGPYEEGGDFRDEGITGVRRFLEGAWRIVREVRGDGAASEALQRATHRAIKKVTEDTEGLHYNTAIAALMTLTNDIRKHGPADRWVAESLVIMLAPYAPHIAEELWEGLGHPTTVFDACWPAYDPAMIVEETIEVPVMVDGKVRSRIVVPRNAEADALRQAALADQRIQALLAGKAGRVVVASSKVVSIATR
jgi:leucyl-tRNA synthetase